MKKACVLVEELIERIHQKYKDYCEKNNITPANNIQLKEQKTKILFIKENDYFIFYFLFKL